MAGITIVRRHARAGHAAQVIAVMTDRQARRRASGSTHARSKKPGTKKNAVATHEARRRPKDGPLERAIEDVKLGEPREAAAQAAP
ncbi:MULTISPECIES: hypothetical protein [Burkholderia]|uniref:hypothetical protein n=1 Tax=Burkholderia TaxID=32008 RepID=UPI0011A4BFA0|nr:MULTISPECIES: hypothetical protein [Burkholderia]MDN7736780.1 hypothetical protein [Burkholderia gladioli]